LVKQQDLGIGIQHVRPPVNPPPPPNKKKKSSNGGGPRKPFLSFERRVFYGELSRAKAPCSGEKSPTVPSRPPQNGAR